MRNKRMAAGAAVVALAAAGAMLTAAPNAVAAPGSCTITFPDSNHASSLCTTGTGHHRIHMLLDHPDPRIGRTAVVGDWAAVGQYSTTYFPSWIIASYWVDLTDS